MRALLIFPQLPLSFWTFKRSCQLAGRKALMPPLSLITVAALLPQHWEFRLVDLNTCRLQDDDWQWADMVLLTGMLVQREGLLSLIAEARRRGKTVVVGGPYPTSLPEEVLDAGADFLFQGEAEHTISPFLAALKEGRRRSVFKEDTKPDLTFSPTPRFDLLNFADYLTLGIQTSRGCPFNCEFCDIINLYGRKPRYKAPEQLLMELSAIYSLGWRSTVFFCDDNFIGNKDHARGILNLLIPWMKSHGEPFNFWTQTSVNLGQDQEMIDLLTEANFSFTFLGVETPDVELLSRSRKYQNLHQPLSQSISRINANGLSVVASFIIGLDGEEAGAGERICKFVEENNIPLAMVNTLQVLPNTALWDRLQREGRLLPERTSGNSSGDRMNYLPTRPESDIMAEYLDAVDRLYERSGYLARTFRSLLAMRPTRRTLAKQRGEAVPPSVNKNPTSLWSCWQDIITLLRLIWSQGMVANCRGQFWRQLLQMKQRNPSRLKKYLISLTMGESLAQLRDEVIRKGTTPPKCDRG
jgi:radical SAM superfamily enzyme YgiQ (UPF0313 family)